MRQALRPILNNLFTLTAGASVAIAAMALLLVLGPIVVRGSGAIFFTGTVEWREMQFRVFGRGDRQEVQQEVERAHQARQAALEIFDRFSRGIDVSAKRDAVVQAYRDLKDQLENRRNAGELDADQVRQMRRSARRIREDLEQALATDDNEQALALLQNVLDSPDREAFDGTVAARMFEVAEQYRQVVQTVNLSVMRDEYAASLEEVEEILNRLFGDESKTLERFHYGAARMDRVNELMDELMWRTVWVDQGEGELRKQERIPREKAFEGTEMAGLFSYMRNHVEEMFLPKGEIYWQYLIDRNVSGYFFGGVGPEILGTLLLTLCSMLVAVPLGVVSAAYLVEVGKESLFMRVLRTCINTLAGVPSIVFGLFGFVFFCLRFLPSFGATPDRSILAGSLTLGVLVLPVIIRASEEAIRSVPQSYKEASLALGAGSFRTFVTITLPAALPGILTGIILSMSRAAGETAPIYLTAALATASLPESVMDPTLALPVSSYYLAVGHDVAPEVPHNQFGMIMVLVLLVLILNVAAILVRSRVSARLRGR